MRNHTIKGMKITSALALPALLLMLAVPASAQGRFAGNSPGRGLAASAQPLTEDEAKWVTYMRE